MEDKKVFIKVDPREELPSLISQAKEEYAKSIDFEDFDELFLSGTMTEGDINKIVILYAEKIEELLFKPVSLTELMVGFAEWASDEYTYDGDRWKPYGVRNVLQYYTTKELVDIYLKEKKI